MFGLFSKKEKPVPVTDLIWLNDNGKKAGLLQLLKQKPAAVLCTWFADTATAFESFLSDKGPGHTIYLQRELHTSITNGKEVIFLEHYPLFKKEQELFRSLNAAAITVLSSLEDPLLIQFGGERISTLMRTLGVDEEEAISHKMITSSLVNAQQKLDEKITTELLASSAEEWFKRNRSEK
ncbi:MAG: hypothetical protein IPJ29_09320 [Chitinophagaceae bacterium]|nr:hypothetical protein [Chitinophagaceae bacterium]